jgi:dTMP kinase
MRGLFITLEGIDGCGKSTQLDLLARALAVRGLDLVVTREPGGTVTGERIRSLLSSAIARLDAKTELFLIVAARAQHVEEVLRPAKQSGRMVICDRYTDSTAAFQGYGRGLDLRTINELNRFATGGLAPDLTIIFDLDPRLARARLDARASSERGGASDSALQYIDDEDVAFHERVREGYLTLARAEPERLRVVDASGTVAEAREQVMAVVLPLIERRDDVEA